MGGPATGNYTRGVIPRQVTPEGRPARDETFRQVVVHESNHKIRPGDRLHANALAKRQPADASALHLRTLEAPANPIGAEHPILPMPLPTLSLLDTRVLGVLVEKQRTVPDTYPLTLNALLAGCNQKTSRDPILNATESEAQAVIDHLRSLSLIVESSGGRVMRYAHNMERVLAVPSQAVAILAALMLRGPQTVGELRINTERLHRFADTSAVEAFLQELAERPAGALVIELPRQPGSRETRWAQLLSAAPNMAPSAAALAGENANDVVTVTEIAALKANLAHLQNELAGIKAVVAKLCAELGIGGM